MANPTLKAKATLDDSRFNRTLKRMVTSAKKANVAIGRGIGRAGAAVGGAAMMGGGAAGLGGLMLARNTAKNTDALYRMSKMSGVAVRDLAVLQDVFEENAADLQTLSTALKFMEKNLAEAAKGGTPLARMLSATGESVKEFLTRKPADQFIALSKSIVALKTPLERAHAATAAFGRQGIELIPVLHAVADTDFTALNQEADAIASMAGQMHKLTVETTRTWDAISQLGIGISKGLAPAMAKINEMAKNGDFMRWGNLIGRFMNKPWNSMGFETQADSDIMKADSPPSDDAVRLGIASGKVRPGFSGTPSAIAAAQATLAAQVAKIQNQRGAARAPGLAAMARLRTFKTASFGSSLGSSGGLKTGSLPVGSASDGNPLSSAAFGKVRRGDTARAKAERTKQEEDTHSILKLLQKNLEQ